MEKGKAEKSPTDQAVHTEVHVGRRGGELALEMGEGIGREGGGGEVSQQTLPNVISKRIKNKNSSSTFFPGLV